MAENPPLSEFDCGRIEFAVREQFSTIKLSGSLVLPAADDVSLGSSGKLGAVVMLPGCINVRVDRPDLTEVDRQRFVCLLLEIPK